MLWNWVLIVWWMCSSLLSTFWGKICVEMLMWAESEIARWIELLHFVSIMIRETLMGGLERSLVGWDLDQLTPLANNSPLIPMIAYRLLCMRSQGEVVTLAMVFFLGYRVINSWGPALSVGVWIPKWINCTASPINLPEKDIPPPAKKEMLGKGGDVYIGKKTGDVYSRERLLAMLTMWQALWSGYVSTGKWLCCVKSMVDALI